MRISDWSSDVCSSDLAAHGAFGRDHALQPTLIAFEQSLEVPWLHVVARRIGAGGREVGEPRLVVIHAEHELDDRRHRRAALPGDARIPQPLRVALSVLLGCKMNSIGK